MLAPIIVDKRSFLKLKCSHYQLDHILANNGVHIYNRLPFIVDLHAATRVMIERLVASLWFNVLPEQFMIVIITGFRHSDDISLFIRECK
jgi:hypothetical protein